MKLVIDEKLKHRLVGVSVILSLGAIFLPAMMKKSSQRLEHNFSVNVQLPPKPSAPNVAVTDEEQMFKTIKVAKAVDITASTGESVVAAFDSKEIIASAPITKDEVAQVTPLEEVASESVILPLDIAVKEAVNTTIKKEVLAAKKSEKPAKVAIKAIKPTLQKPNSTKVVSKPNAKDVYALQLASFSKLANAQALVSKLHQKGYKANYMRIANKNGVIYKVYVGHSPIKNNVVKLKSQLASAMQLNGFVVTTGVS